MKRASLPSTPASINAEEERVVVALVVILVASIGDSVRDTLAEIFDDARAFLDRTQREHPQTVYLGTSHFEERACRRRPRFSGGHVRPPRVPGWPGDADSPRIRNPRTRIETGSGVGAGSRAAAAGTACARAARRPARDD